MKRTLTTLFVALCVLAVSAQQVRNGGFMNFGQTYAQPKVKTMDQTKAIGDTIFYTDMNNWYVPVIDQPSFAVETVDGDGLTTTNPGYPMAFGFWYDDGTTDWGTFYWMPWDVDTAFYCSATSWFTPAGQADNWLMFGPITLPAGADLSWYHHSNPYGDDGYEVLVSLTGMTAFDFTDPSIWSRPDGTPGDTVWDLVTVEIPGSYCGQQAYFAFHHTATDIDVLWLDEVKIVEAESSISVEENAAIASVKTYPNPANQSTELTFSLGTAGNVSVQVLDYTGRVIRDINLGEMAAGNHNYVLNTSDYAQGLYLLNLNLNETSTSTKFVVKR